MFDSEFIESSAIMLIVFVAWYLAIQKSEWLVEKYNNKFFRTILRLNVVITIAIFSISRSYEMILFQKEFILLYFMIVQPVTLMIESKYREQEKRNKLVRRFIF